MSTEAMTLDKIRCAGLEVLGHHLGPMGMVLFLREYETGRGDYYRASRTKHPVCLPCLSRRKTAQVRPALVLRLIISYQASNPALGQGLGQGTIVLDGQ
jgi:hypothetical protein